MDLKIPKKLEDSRPTVDSWPRKIIEMNMLPQQYHSYFTKWIKESMSSENITYIPRIHKALTKEPEYVMAWFNDTVMFLINNNDNIIQYKIKSKDILSIDYSFNLLNYYVVLNIIDNNDEKQIAFNFNKSKEELLIPILNILLENAPDYEMEVLFHENNICEDLATKSFMMYNFSKFSYRLDTTILDYFWEKEELSTSSSREKMYTEYFISIMEKGITLIASQFYGVDVTHLYWKNIKSLSIEKEAVLQMILKTKQDKVYSLPIDEKNINSAQKFISNFDKCLKEFKTLK